MLFSIAVSLSQQRCRAGFEKLIYFRGTYCALVAASILNIMTPELLHGAAEFVVKYVSQSTMLNLLYNKQRKPDTNIIIVVKHMREELGPTPVMRLMGDIHFVDLLLC